MRYFTRFLLVFAIGFLIFSLTLINYSAPLRGSSFDGVLAALVALAAIVLLLILRISLSIKRKYEENS